jgi:hypothetical protein
MSSCNGVQLRLVPENGADSGADVFDIRTKQSEGSRLRRIAALEYENELLRRTASEIRIELIWLEQLYDSGLRGSKPWASSKED